jgi:hypothetical protein
MIPVEKYPIEEAARRRMRSSCRVQASDRSLAGGRLFIHILCIWSIRGENMKGAFTATTSITIKANTEKVWDSLTNPKLIKQYLFGTEASSWKLCRTSS